MEVLTGAGISQTLMYMLCRRKPYAILHITYKVVFGPGWRGSVQTLSPGPMVDWVMRVQ